MRIVAGALTGRLTDRAKLGRASKSRTILMAPHSVNQPPPCRVFLNRNSTAAMTIPTRLLRPRPALGVALLLAMLCAVWPTGQAHASEGYAQTWGGLTAANANQLGDSGQWGAGVQLGFRAGISDFWSFSGGVEGSYHLLGADEAPNSEVLNLFAGFRYNLDVFQYVPYVGLSVVNFVARPPAAPGDTGALVGGKLTVGVDWRYSREWSLGGMIELHAPLVEPSNFPIYSSAGVNLAYHFRL
jgi:hypothetical protein